MTDHPFGAMVVRVAGSKIAADILSGQATIEALVGLALAVVAFFVLKAMLPTLIRIARALLALAFMLGGGALGVMIFRDMSKGGTTEDVWGGTVLGLVVAAVGYGIGRWVAPPELPTARAAPVIIAGSPSPEPVRDRVRGPCSGCNGRKTIACYNCSSYGNPFCGYCNSTRELPCPGCRGQG